MTGIKCALSWDGHAACDVPAALFPDKTTFTDTAIGRISGPDVFITDWGWIACDHRAAITPELLKGKMGITPLVETLADIWISHGHDLVQHITGAFSFIIWDATKQQLFAARDRLGIKSFCYHISTQGLIASSYLKDLATIDHLRGTPDRMMITDYLLSLGDAPALPEQTFFSRIKRLPPGHTMSIKPGGAPQVNAYWSPTATDNHLTWNDEEAIQKCRALLISATQDALNTDISSGVSASGGLDSSALAAAVTSPTALYFLKSPVPENDESTWVDSLAATGSHTVYTSSPTGVFTHLTPMLTALAEPWSYENLHHDFIVFSNAEETNCRQLLNGYYGDVVIDATLDYLHDIASTHDWPRLLEECMKAEDVQKCPASNYLWHAASGVFESMATQGQWYRFMKDVIQVSKLFHLPLLMLIWHWWLRPLSPKPMRKLYRILTGSQRPVWWELNRQIQPEFATRMDAEHRASTMKTTWTKPLTNPLEAHKAIIGHSSTALALEQMAALGASLNVTPIFPFINEALISFALSLPRTYHGRDGWDRWILRKAMDADLPHEVCWRKGRINYAATALFELQSEAATVNHIIDHWPTLLSEYVDKTTFVSDWKWLQGEHEVSPGSAAAGRRIFRTVLLGKWLEQYG